MSKPFKLNSAFRPSGDQPEAIRRLEEGLEDVHIVLSDEGNRECFLWLLRLINS